MGNSWKDERTGVSVCVEGGGSLKTPEGFKEQEGLSNHSCKT